MAEYDVSTDEAIMSSTITSGLVALSGAIVTASTGGLSSLGSPGSVLAGVTVFGTTWVLSYTGMKGYLPF